jgi:hypothetical protein
MLQQKRGLVATQTLYSNLSSIILLKYNYIYTKHALSYNLLFSIRLNKTSLSGYGSTV